MKDITPDEMRAIVYRKYGERLGEIQFRHVDVNMVRVRGGGWEGEVTAEDLMTFRWLREQGMLRNPQRPAPSPGVLAMAQEVDKENEKLRAQLKALERENGVVAKQREEWVQRANRLARSNDELKAELKKGVPQTLGDFAPSPSPELVMDVTFDPPLECNPETKWAGRIQKGGRLELEKNDKPASRLGHVPSYRPEKLVIACQSDEDGDI